jgi:hypothetical protein
MPVLEDFAKMLESLSVCVCVCVCVCVITQGAGFPGPP